MEIKDAQKKVVEILEKINKKLGIKHQPEGMFLSLSEEIGEVARELSKKQSGYRGDFNKEKLGEELSDIISRTLVIAEDNEIDLDKTFTNKLQKIKQRFKLN